jgi:hypothetical protein
MIGTLSVGLDDLWLYACVGSAVFALSKSRTRKERFIAACGAFLFLVIFIGVLF